MKNILILTVLLATLGLIQNIRVAEATKPAKIDWCHCEPNGNCQSLELPWQALENAGHVNASGNPLHADDHAGFCVGPTVSLTPTVVDATGTVTPTVFIPTLSLTPTESVSITLTVSLSATPLPSVSPTPGVSEEKWEETRRIEGQVFGAQK